MQFLKVAHFAILTEGYNKDEIARAEGGDYWTVNVTLRIVSFLEVREIFFYYLCITYHIRDVDT